MAGQNFSPGGFCKYVTRALDRSKVLLSPLHIKLGLIKQYVKALDRKKEEGECFKYLKKQFPKLSDEKITEGIFDGSQIHKMLRDDDFISTMTDKEQRG